MGVCECAGKSVCVYVNACARACGKCMNMSICEVCTRVGVGV